jgi:putative transposase
MIFVLWYGDLAMARAARIEYPGALYHIITRGNQKQRIFVDDKDRKRYMALLVALKKAYAFRLYAYVLMRNHVHLLMETGQVPLSRIMQRLTGGYTQHFNRRHGLTGHLFQGRYKAILCDKDSYLLELTRYLHLNPVRVKAVQDPAQYPWSSYRAYLGKGEKEEGVEVGEVLSHFGKGAGEARHQYRKLVLDGIGAGHQAAYYEAAEGRILGDGAFVEAVKAKSGEKDRAKLNVSPQDLLARVCRALGKKPEEVVGASKDRERVRLRQLFCYVGRTYTDLQVKTLASLLKVDPTCVSRCVAVVELQLGKDRGVRSAISRLAENIIYHA